MRLRAVELGDPASDLPPILLLHGFTGRSSAWPPALLDGLSGEGGAEPRRLILPDLPGHGASAPPRAPEVQADGGTAFEATVDALAGLLEERGLEKADWVGYSMGGRIALAAAVLRPERVRRLVLEGASPGIGEEAGRQLRREEDEALARRLAGEAPQPFAGIEEFVEWWLDRPLFETQRSLPSEVREAARILRLANRPEGLAAALRALGTGAQPSYWDRLSAVVAPTLLLTGELDVKFEAIASRMADRVPSVRRRSVPGSGHAVHLEAPELWLREVRGFLAG
jgi:2-succinyl-6-hydroxy-2,4-cyclohexadiene-1-carboxylate synthase